MEDPTDKSSLPLLLAMTGAVLLVAGGGWIYLGRDQGPQAVPNTVATEETAAPVTEPLADEEVVEDATAAEPVPESVDDSTLEADLRKARLASEAEILVFPESASALLYYSRALRQAPDNAVVIAEFDAVLGRIEQTVRQHLDAGELIAAYELSSRVEAHRPDHPLVVATQQLLDSNAEALIESALQSARNGDDDGAAASFAQATALPDRNSEYLNAVRTTLAEIRETRLQAERDRQARSRLADNQARAAWAAAVRQEIADGDLISPAGANAVDIFNEENGWDAERQVLREEIRTALESTITSLINSLALGDAERHLDAATLFSAAETIEAFQQQLDARYIDIKSTTLAPTTQLTRINATPPRYPNRAASRGVEGWVDVYFTVTTTGETADIEIIASEPSNIFDDAAIEAVSAWTFEPVEYRGQIINQRSGTKLVFALE